MIVPLLLLGAFVCAGFSETVSKEAYGRPYTIVLQPGVNSIEFRPMGQQDSTVLWKRDDPSFSSYGTRWEVTGYSFTIRNLTQRDSGQYILKDKNQIITHARTIEVKERKESYNFSPGEKLRFSINLEPKSCNVYFIPRSDADLSNRATIVHEGRLHYSRHFVYCSGFDLVQPCGISVENLQTSCSGEFEVRDQNLDLALVVNLSVFSFSETVSKEAYGKPYTIVLQPGVNSIEFRPMGQQDSTVLWKRDDPSFSSYSTRWEVTGYSFTIRNLTQRDSGQYILKDKNQIITHARTIEVKERYGSYSFSPGEKLRFSINLEPKSCNVYFIPKSDADLSVRATIVREGRLQYSSHIVYCSGFDLVQPCGISVENLQTSCSGEFEVRDQNDDLALVLNLSELKAPKTTLYMAIGVTVGVFALFCCCCLKCCGCGKCSSNKNDSEPEPAVPLEKYSYQSEGPGQHQPSQPLMPSYPVPSYTHSDPLIHNPPTVNAADAQAPAPAPVPVPVPVPSPSDNEPRFELKGMNFPMTLPLSADASYQDVYTSDKLTFK